MNRVKNYSNSGDYTQSKRNVESWVDEIELAAKLKDGNFYIGYDARHMIENFLYAIDYEKVVGEFTVQKSPFVNEYMANNDAITYSTKTVGFRKDHDGTWEFNGCYNDDYFQWISDVLVFFHHADGSGSDWIIGNAESKFVTSNPNVLARFYKQFEVNRWDYYDI